MFTCTVAYRGQVTFYKVPEKHDNNDLVVMDTFNNVARDEDNILDQIYIKQTCLDFYYDEVFLISKHYTKMHTNIESSLKANFMIFFL